MESTGRITIPQYWRLVRGNANFRRLWLAQIVSEIGDWMYTVAIYTKLLSLTGMASSVALAFILQVLPQALVSPMAGVLNDRLSRRKLMIISDVARAVVVALMLLAQSKAMIWLIYVLLFLEAVFWALFEPGRAAVIPNVAGKDEVVAANSLSSITWSFNFSVGFSIGGFIAAIAGGEAVFVINSLSFLLSAWFISRMKFNEPHLHAVTPMRWRDLFDFSPVAEGARYVAKDKRLLAMMFVKCGLGCMGANWTLVTILGDRKFPLHFGGMDAKSGGMLGMSILMGSRGLGALIGPVIGTYLTGRNEARMRTGIACGFGLGAIGYIVLGQTPTMLAAALCLLAAHAGGAIVWVFSTTLLQMNTEDKFRGRVFSSEFAFMTISMSLSNAVAGAFLDAGFPVETVISAAGVVFLIPGLLWLRALRLWSRPAGSRSLS